jgi:sorbitol-specific phosphotransferase system component IIC
MVAGIIVLVLGLVMIGAGVSGLRGTTSTINTFSQQHPGEYVSSEIILNSSSAVVVRSPASVGGLIPAGNLSSVNSANIASYALSTKSTGGGSATYTSLTGDYYYVVFSSSPPSSSIIIAGNLRQTIVSGVLALLGFLFVIVGIILSLVGWRRGRRANSKNKKPSVSDSDYYANRQDGSQQPPPPPSSSSP